MPPHIPQDSPVRSARAGEPPRAGVGGARRTGSAGERRTAFSAGSSAKTTTLSTTSSPRPASSATPTTNQLGGRPRLTSTSAGTNTPLRRSHSFPGSAPASTRCAWWWRRRPCGRRGSAARSPRPRRPDPSRRCGTWRASPRARGGGCGWDEAMWIAQVAERGFPLNPTPSLCSGSQNGRRRARSRMATRQATRTLPNSGGAGTALPPGVGEGAVDNCGRFELGGGLSPVQFC